MKILKYLSTLLIIISLCGCEEFTDLEKGEPIPYPVLDSNNYLLKITDISSSNSITMEASGETKTIRVKHSAGVKWEITGVPEWLTVAPKVGGGETEDITVVSITSTANTSEKDREAELTLASTISSWPYKYKFIVSQVSTGPFAKLDSDKFNSSHSYTENIPSVGQTLAFNIISNLGENLSIRFEASGNEVCTYQYDSRSGKLTLPFTANPSTSSRTFYLYLSNGEQQLIRYAFTQSAGTYGFVNSEGNVVTSLNYPTNIKAQGETITLQINAIAPDKVKFEAGSRYSSSNITLETEYNQATQQVKVTIPVNETTSSRDFAVKLCSTVDNTTFATAYLTQSGGTYGFVNSDGSTVYSYNYPEKVSAFGQTVRLTVQATIPDQIQFISSFRNESTSAGQTVTSNYLPNSGELEVIIPENLYTSSREVMIQMKSSDGSILHSTAYITQGVPGISLTGQTSTIDIDARAQSFDIYFDSTIDWSATVSSEWATVSPAGGAKGKNRSVKVTLTENTNSSSRSCTVYLKTVNGVGNQPITVRQAAPGLTVSNTYFAVHENIPDNNGKLTITSSAPWSIKSRPDWATLSPAAGGAGTFDVELKVDYQEWVNGLQLREGDIVVQIDGTNITKSIKVRQYY